MLIDRFAHTNYINKIIQSQYMYIFVFDTQFKDWQKYFDYIITR